MDGAAPTSADYAADYLAKYAVRYRLEYERFTALPPEGAGYPRLLPGPYIGDGAITCYLADDGFVLADYSGEPAYAWYFAGGPAFLVDQEPSRTPSWVVDRLKAEGLYGENIGISRIVAKDRLPIEEWTGALPVPLETAKRQVDGLTIVAKKYDITWRVLIARLTFGAFGTILDLRLPDSKAPFWNPHQLRRIGISTADWRNRRWFSLLELSPHVDPAAWDVRALPTRVNVDIRRDFLDAVGSLERDGGTIKIPGPDAEPPLELALDRLARLEESINGLQRLLDEHGEDPEWTFHQYIEENPVLLDVYARTVSKPRFQYPPGESPLGKAYVEPDFVLIYPNERYRLVELERPGKALATKSGEPRSGVTQAAFQIAEWRDYINNHYASISKLFPGISSKPMSTVIISRATSARPGGIGLHRYLAILREQLAVDEVITYDDLISRGWAAVTQIASAQIVA
jgi:hypothetical protein